MMFHKILSLTAVVLALTLASTVGLAADVYTEKFNMYLDGEIRRGDSERIAVIAAEAKFIDRLVVNSSGGDLNEAMRIVSLVKDLRWNVRVANGKVCASACFFVWLAGEYRSSSGAVNDDGTLKPQEKRDRWIGVVGIHRPYFRDIRGNPENPKKQEVMMRNVKAYLAAEGVSQYLIDEMMARPSNDIFWLRERDLNSIGEYTPGVEEMLIAKCGFKRSLKVIDENWSRDKIDQLNDCVYDALGPKVPSYKAYSAKLRKGWRPWNK